MLAMVTSGEYASVLECVEQLVKKKEVIQPDPLIVERYEKSFQKYKKIYPSIKKLYKELL